MDDERLLGGTSSTAWGELCKTVSQRQGINKECLLTVFSSIRCIPGEQQVAGSEHKKKGGSCTWLVIRLWDFLLQDAEGGKSS